jgi:hypothetical protein
MTDGILSVFWSVLYESVIRKPSIHAAFLTIFYSCRSTSKPLIYNGFFLDWDKTGANEARTSSFLPKLAVFGRCVRSARSDRGGVCDARSRTAWPQALKPFMPQAKFLTSPMGRYSTFFGAAMTDADDGVELLRELVSNSVPVSRRGARRSDHLR